MCLSEDATFRHSVQSEPQLEAVGVVDLDLLQLRAQQDVLLRLLWQGRENRKRHALRLCAGDRRFSGLWAGLTWLAKSR